MNEKASYFSLSAKKKLGFSNYKKPIKKARKNYFVIGEFSIAVKL